MLAVIVSYVTGLRDGIVLNIFGLFVLFCFSIEYRIDWVSGIQHNMSPTEHVPRELNEEAESLPTHTKKQLKKQEEKQREKARLEKTMQQPEDSVERPKTFRKDFCDERQLECINCRGGEKRLTRCRGCW